MIGACRLNNKSMRNIRRTDAYQAIAIDLALLGVISKEECEMLINGGIPSGIVLPNGKSNITSEKELPPKPDFIQTEPEKEPDQETVSDGATTDDVDSVNPEPIPGVTVMPGDETPDPVDVADGMTPEGDSADVTADEDKEPADDEGRTESDN